MARFRKERTGMYQKRKMEKRRTKTGEEIKRERQQKSLAEFLTYTLPQIR